MSADSSLGREQRLDEILAAFWRADEAGVPTDRQALLARHPQFAAELAEFFDDLDSVERLARPLRAVRHELPPTEGSPPQPRDAEDTVDDPPKTADKSAPSAGTKVRCPTCHNPIQLAKESELVLCPGCGNSFRLSEAETTDTVSGMRTLGKFQLLERLGLGSFGAVWKARDAELDRTVALKIPHAGLRIEKQELERFQREARAAAQLRHPNIVSVHEVARLNDLPVIVSEYVPGVPLKDLLEARPLTFRQSAALAAQVADALEYAHSMGVVHRDVKPANVMVLGGGAHNTAVEAGSQAKAELADVGKPMILDFGLALRDAAEQTMTVDGHVLGTPAYMSPEQAAGRSHLADRRSDVYSLGVVLYQMLTGELPFRGSRAWLLDQVLHTEPRSPRKLNGKVPRDLETITLKCLRKEPARRYATAHNLAEDLRRFLKGEPISARPVGTVYKVLRWGRRNPATAGAMVASLVALLALAGLGVGLVYNRELAGARRQEETQRQRAEAALAKAQTYLDFHRLGLAQRAWWENNPGRTRQLLAEIPEPHGWEWHYLNRLAHAELRILAGHDAEVSSVGVSPDGSYYASASVDGSVLLWDARAGRELLTVRGLSPWGCLAFSGAEPYLAITTGTTLNPGEIKVWQYERPRAPGQPLGLRELFTHRGVPGEMSRLAFSPDGRRLAVALGRVASENRGQVRIYELPSGKELRVLRTGQEAVVGIAFSSDGKHLAGSSSQLSGVSFENRAPAMLLVWDADSGRELHRRPAHAGAIYHVAFSPDGRRLASASADRTVKLWDARTYEEVGVLRGHSGVVLAAAFRPDGRQLATASTDGTVRVWAVDGGAEEFTLRGHTAEVYSVAYDRDGRQLVSAGMDRTLRVWDIAAGQRGFQQHTGAVASVAFSPDGRWLASGGVDQTVRFMDLHQDKAMRLLGRHAEAVSDVAFSGDGRWVASAAGDWQKLKQPGEIKLWDPGTGHERLRLQAHAGVAWGLAFSPNGVLLASAGGEFGSPGEVKLWDSPSGRPVQTLAYEKGIYRVAFSPDGSLLAGIAHADGTLLVWDAATGRERFRLAHESSRLYSLAFSPDGTRLATGGTDQTIRIWDPVGGKMVAALRGHGGDVSGLAFSPDGQRLASGGSDQAVKLWDLATGEEVLTLRGHTGQVNAVAFSPGGHLLASASEDGSVRLWDATPLDPVRSN